MNAFQRILVATDLSAPARRAAERAALLSRQTQAALDLLHVADLAPLDYLRQWLPGQTQDMPQRVQQAAQAQVQALAELLLQRHGVHARTHVRTGVLTRELVGVLQDVQADLLVCGARGESVVRHLLLGTTAQRILSTTPCPVLVVKQSPHEGYRRVLVPVDFSAASLGTLALARAIAPGAELVLLHAFEVPFEGHLRYARVEEDTLRQYRTVARQVATEKLEALRLQAGLGSGECLCLVQYGDPAQRIVEQEQDQDCDLIVMGKHGEGALADLLLGSVARHVLTESQCDVLVAV
ncbi:MAG: universal stress protein [Burkholderiales bacterium]|nr:universal stress protein [Burkholderiales bacterium]